MSSTRTNLTGEFKPERWASSPEFDRPLKANLVAARCSVLESKELRQLCWMVQFLSMRRGGLRWTALEVVPDAVATDDVETWLSEIVLNPATNQELAELAPMLRELLASYTRQRGNGVAVTEIGRTINDTLDYCSQSKCLVMISGRPRLGKTFAARTWVELHPGQARYCEVPSSPDETSWFMSLARALGITIESNAKRKNLQPRIEATLQGGDLTLVLDECAHLWPSHNYRQHSRPARISWIMGMINAGASIALLVTPNFFANARDYIEHSRWNDKQFMGRVERYIQLPEIMPVGELEKVARAWLPHGDKRSIEALADYAALSQKYLAAIEHAVKYALHLAKKDGQMADWPDIQCAIKSGVMPADEALRDVVRNATSSRAISTNGTRH